MTGAMGDGKGKGKGKGKGPVTFTFEGQQLVAVNRDFYFLHPNVANRSDSECERMRTKYGILVLPAGNEAIPKPIDAFEELPFPKWVMKELRCRFTEPRPVQVQTWPAAMKGHDIVGIAETGSGKTLAYVLPMLVHVAAQEEVKPGEGPIGLVLVPTVNLCRQVAATVNTYGREFPGFKCLSIFGNVDSAEMSEQADEAQRRCDVMVATPGRLRALLRDRMTNLRRCTYVVLDEADELLRQDFEDQLGSVVCEMRDDRQVLLFSATWPDRVEQFTEKVCRRLPMKIVAGERGANKNVKQSFHLARASASETCNDVKLKLLVEKLNGLKGELSHDCKVLVFVSKKESISSVLTHIRDSCGISCAEGYGSEEGRGFQSNRDAVLQRFVRADGDVHLIVATQVLGRGLDVRSIRWVINFDAPLKIVEYIHRIGRTARGEEMGKSWTLLEEHNLAIAREWKQMLVEAEQPVPSFIENALPKWRHYKELLNTWHEQEGAAKAQREADAVKERRAVPVSREIPGPNPMANSSVYNRTLGSQSNPSASSSWLSPNVDYDKPFFEKREDGYVFCTLCHKYVDDGHVGGPKHKNNEAWYFSRHACMPKVEQVAAGQSVAEAATRHYLESLESRARATPNYTPMSSPPIQERSPPTSEPKNYWDKTWKRWYSHDPATGVSTWLSNIPPPAEARSSLIS